MPKIYLIRHGQTDWTISGQHTGTTDLPLTEQGCQEAKWLGQRLKGHAFAKIFVSPLKRAQQTCELASLAKHAYTEPDLIEWNYGAYEGKTTPEILKTDPHWNLFQRGAPQGESLADVTIRANTILRKLKASQGDIALFSHGHFLRVLTACYLGLPPQEGSRLVLSPASLSILGNERTTPALLLWNDTSHLKA